MELIKTIITKRFLFENIDEFKLESKTLEVNGFCYSSKIINKDGKIEADFITEIYQ